MSGFFGIGGKNSGQQNQAIGNLNSLFNFGFGTGKNLAASGTGATDSALGYFSKILGGNRTAMQQAQAPATNSALGAADALRRQRAAMGTARGGGVAGQNQTQQDAVQKQVDDAMFAARPAAAQATAQIGEQQLNTGLGFESTAGGAAEGAGGIATNARGQHAQELQESIKEIFGFG